MTFHTTDTRARAIALYESGLSVRVLSAQMGLSPATTRKWISDAGIMRARPAAPAVLKQRVVKLRASGWSIAEISQMVGRPHSTVNTWLKQDEVGRLYRGSPSSDEAKLDRVQEEAKRHRQMLRLFIPRRAARKWAREEERV